MKQAFLAFTILYLLHSSVHAAEKIRIGFPEFNSSTFTLPMAQIKGFFHEEGLQAELIRIRSAVALPALTSGEIDYHTVVAPAVTAALRGIPVRVVGLFHAGPDHGDHRSSRDQDGSRSQRQGHRAEQHRRRTGKHGAYHVETLRTRSDKDVKFLATGGIETRFAALRQGLTVATAGSTPADYLGKKFGYVVLARAYDLFSYPNTGLVASVKSIKENPDRLKRVIKAGIKANRYILQNREGTIQVMMQWMRVDRDTATATDDGSLKSFNDDGSVSDAGLRIALDESRKAANITGEVAFSEVADF